MIEVVDLLLSAAFPSVELFFSFLIPLLPASTPVTTSCDPTLFSSNRGETESRTLPCLTLSRLFVKRSSESKHWKM
ncbi:Oidioi.mRNA.OKI2018_I69.PAR.g10081.t1.cds [Oikopleura dioica]|uniref:Oidioi.mRNA.OKI2018_I69.PAR.g10081.t1.cds n=1 Tax=Oikopleura dioica TaxID=34765 RepID=A0ABN7RT28_OIKDI|nr:Oidioi.mRNA.OKI2018_I69.PAR.g10081.t1.cds [Oikopleura dioica]